MHQNASAVHQRRLMHHKFEGPVSHPRETGPLLRAAEGIRTLDPELGKLVRAPVIPATWRNCGELYELYEHYEPHEQLSRISSTGLMHRQVTNPLRGYNRSMSIATGIIRGGRLQVEGDHEPLPEGRRFTVMIEDEGNGFHLDDASIQSLREAQAEIRRGNFVTEEQILKDLGDD